MSGAPKMGDGFWAHFSTPDSEASMFSTCELACRNFWAGGGGGGGDDKFNINKTQQDPLAKKSGAKGAAPKKAQRASRKERALPDKDECCLLACCPAELCFLAAHTTRQDLGR